MKIRKPIAEIIDQSNQGSGKAVGLRCPRCGCVQFSVAGAVRCTKRQVGAVVRYRECRACGKHFRTIER